MAVTINGDGVVDVGGNASSAAYVRLYEDSDNGTNYVDLIAPASVASNRTITLPDNTGTIITSGSTTGIDASALSTGTVAAARLPAGSVLQVVSTTKTDVTSFTSVNTNNYVDITGMSVIITPTSATNKILVMYTANVSQSTTATVHVRLLRDSTSIGQGVASGNRLGDSTIFRPADTPYGLDIGCLVNYFLDSPNTTSATTYKLQGTLGSTYNGTFYLNRSPLDSNFDYGGRTSSTITVMEIAG